MAFKWIYFLVLLVVTVLQSVQAATQLRLVDGLLIIDGVQEGPGNEDFHGHGYLNRNRAKISARRLLKDVQKTTTELSVRNRFFAQILETSVEDITKQDVISEQRSRGIEETTKSELEKKTERHIDPTKESTDKKQDPDSSQTDFTHTTAVNSVTSPTMDVITIVWYFSTFIALVAFFVVMVCSDKYCTRSSAKPEEAVTTAPATPAPSYREFAPPSYDSVMKKYKSRVFIIPMLNDSGELKGSMDGTITAPPPPPPIEEGEQVGETPTPTVIEPDQGSLDKPRTVRSLSGGDIAVVVLINESHRQQEQLNTK